MLSKLALIGIKLYSAAAAAAAAAAVYLQLLSSGELQATAAATHVGMAYASMLCLLNVSLQVPAGTV
jgi:hypothetical protein